MPILKNEFPVLEYDSDVNALVKNRHAGIKLPEKAVFAFTGDNTNVFAEANNARIAVTLELITRNYNIYNKKKRSGNMSPASSYGRSCRCAEP